MSWAHAWAADGQDGNKLQLEISWANFFFFKFGLCLRNLTKPLIMENSLDIFLLVFYKHFVHDNGT